MESLRKYAPILHTGFAENYTPEQMRQFVTMVKERGYSGFSVEGKSSTGPTTDIDGWVDGYMRGVALACEEAARQGIDVWIFDEWGYPTGTAAGRTMTGHPEWRSKKLHCALDIILEEGETVTMTAPPHLLAAAAWHVDRSVFGGPVGGYTHVPVIDGKLTYTADHRRCRFAAAAWEYDSFRTVGVYVQNPEDDTQCTLDLLCYEAVEKMLSVMHEEYWRRMPQYFGKPIKGFFYDEPFLSFPLAYTFDLAKDFIEQKGYDPVPRLPLLVCGLDAELKRDWRDVATSRMAEAFFGGMARWCHAHGVELVGHQDLDHDIRSTNTVSGDFFKNNRYNDAPGVDYIWAQIRPDHTADYPRFAGSFRRMTGKNHATSESFAATGNCKTPDYMRWAMEYQALRGIDRFYLMIADPAGAVPGAGQGFGTPLDFAHPASQYFAEEVNHHVALVSRMLNETAPAAEVALYIPRDQISESYASGRPSEVSIHQPWDWVNSIAEGLIYAPVDFEYIWDDMVASLPMCGDGALQMPTGQKIRTIIVPPTDTLPESVSARLHEMQQNGANIVFVSRMPADFAGSTVCTYPEDIGRYIGAARTDGAAEAADVPEAADRCGKGHVSLTTRMDAEHRYLFFLNESMKPYCGESVQMGDSYLQKYDFEAESWVDTEDRELRLRPLEIAIYRTAKALAGTVKAVPQGTVLPVNGWQMRLPDGTVKALLELEDWRKYAGTYFGVLDYTARIEVPQDGRYRLNLGRVCWSAIVCVDGGVPIKLPFEPYACDLTLTGGVHEITVSVLNADAVQSLGSPEVERAYTNRLKSYFENDRDFVVSGLLGPVTLQAYND